MNRSIRVLISLVVLLLVFAGCSAPAPAAPAAAPASGASAPEAPAAEAPAAEAPTEDATTSEESSEAPAASDAVTSTEAVTDAAGDASASASTQVRGVRTFVIIPSESLASYIADEEFFADALSKYGINAGKQDTIGTTQEINGQITLDLDDLSNALGDNRFTVMLNTLQSDQGLRDGYIRTNGPRFNQYPEATFVAHSIEGAPAAYNDGDEVNFTLVGDFTMREITQPVSFNVAARLTGDILTGVAETTVLMSDYGIAPLSFLNTLTVNDEIGIKLEFTAQAQ